MLEWDRSRHSCSCCHSAILCCCCRCCLFYYYCCCYFFFISFSLVSLLLCARAEIFISNSFSVLVSTHKSKNDVETRLSSFQFTFRNIVVVTFIDYYYCLKGLFVQLVFLYRFIRSLTVRNSKANLFDLKTKKSKNRKKITLIVRDGEWMCDSACNWVIDRSERFVADHSIVQIVVIADGTAGNGLCCSRWFGFR